MGGLGLTLQLLLELLAAAILVPIAGGLYQWAGSARDTRLFPAPGRLVDVGGCRLHIDVRGEGSPVVVFEAGIAATSLSWSLIQPEIAKLTRTASYDRAWLGWSDATPKRRGIDQVVEELRTLLDGAGLVAPRILVAHSFGGLVARVYAARYPAEVAGMVLVDPVAAGEWANPSESHRKSLGRGIALSRRGAILARLGVVRFAVNLLSAGSPSVPMLVAQASAGRGAAFTQRIVGEIGKLPREVWPMIQAHWCDPKCFEGMARYLETLPESAAAVERGVASTPLIVLSAANANPAQRAEHESLARAPNTRLEIVAGSGHWIQLDRPDVVIRAISELVARTRGPKV
jgi:pimeloyl-ACP methyl ester carboxylesterase